MATIDYDKATGNGGVMRIKDTGSTVYFYIKAGSTQTWFGSCTYSWTMNGSGSSTFSYSTGAAWKLIRSANVTSNQTVMFAIGASGTSGIGGPTSFSVYINRATVPPAPTPVTFSSITKTSVYTTFHNQGNGGATVTQWQLGWGTNSSSVQNYTTSDGTQSITGLASGVRYYFWARGYNSQGWGAWSSRRDVTTLKVVPAPTSPAPSVITQTSIVSDFANQGGGVGTFLRWELGYGTSSSSPQTIITSVGSGLNTLSGLPPATTYYLWARGVNTAGNGPWSARSSARTIAGARVNINGVWREAVPYVNVNGVWRLAQPYGRIAGVWKKSV